MNRWKPEERSDIHLAIVATLCFIFVIPTSYFFEYGTVAIAWIAAGRLTKASSPYRYWWIVWACLTNYFFAVFTFDLFGRTPELILLALESLILSTLMFFSRETVSVSKPLQAPLLLVSRFTLEIFVFHFSLCQIFVILFGE